MNRVTSSIRGTGTSRYGYNLDWRAFRPRLVAHNFCLFTVAHPELRVTLSAAGREKSAFYHPCALTLGRAAGPEPAAGAPAGADAAATEGAAGQPQDGQGWSGRLEAAGAAACGQFASAHTGGRGEEGAARSSQDDPSPGGQADSPRTAGPDQGGRAVPSSSDAAGAMPPTPGAQHPRAAGAAADSPGGAPGSAGSPAAGSGLAPAAGGHSLPDAAARASPQSEDDFLPLPCLVKRALLDQASPNGGAASQPDAQPDAAQLGPEAAAHGACGASGTHAPAGPAAPPSPAPGGADAGAPQPHEGFAGRLVSARDPRVMDMRDALAAAPTQEAAAPPGVTAQAAGGAPAQAAGPLDEAAGGAGSPALPGALDDRTGALPDTLQGTAVGVAPTGAAAAGSVPAAGSGPGAAGAPASGSGADATAAPPAAGAAGDAASPGQQATVNGAAAPDALALALAETALGAELQCVGSAGDPPAAGGSAPAGCVNGTGPAGGGPGASAGPQPSEARRGAPARPEQGQGLEGLSMRDFQVMVSTQARSPPKRPGAGSGARWSRWLAPGEPAQGSHVGPVTRKLQC